MRCRGATPLRSTARTDAIMIAPAKPLPMTSATVKPIPLATGCQSKKSPPTARAGVHAPAME